MSTIYYHKHHIIPEHMGGTDDPENLIEVTVEQHALLHKQLWEDLGHWQDYAAWQGLSGRMGKEELIRFIQSKTHKGKIVSEETRKRMSDSQKGKKQSSKTIEKRVSKMRGKKRPPFGEEWKRKLSESRKARPAHNKGISGPLLGTKKELVMCPHCDKEGGKPCMMKWHFDNCKMKEAC